MNKNRLYELKNELGILDKSTVPDTEKIIGDVFEKAGIVTYKKNTFRRIKTVRIIAVAAFITVAVTFTVLAATLGWHEKLMEHFGNPTKEQMELMNGGFDAPAVSGTDNGYTVNVINTLADNHGLYVLYELILPEHYDMSKPQAREYMTEIYHRVLVSPAKDETDGVLMSMGVGRNVIMEADKNKIVVCEYIGLAKGVSDECKVSLAVGDSYYIDPQTISGNFNIKLSWNYRYEDVGRTIDVQRPLKVNEVNDNTLVKIDISPISVWVVVEGDDILTGIRPIIRFVDGTVLEYDTKDRESIAMFSSYLDERHPKGVSTLGYVFDSITDPTTIQSITVGDCVVELR